MAWVRFQSAHGSVLQWRLHSDAGGDRAAIIYTVAETAKLNGLDPEAYITTVLDRLAHGHTIGRLDELLPWNIRLERTQ